MPRIKSIEQINTARTVIAKARKLVVPPIERARVVDNPILAVFPHDNVMAFKKAMHGALLGRVKMATGEYIRIYNPNTSRWENYPVKTFESSFFTLSAGVGMDRYAIVDGVFHASSGTDYCTNWPNDRLVVVLRMTKPE